MKIGFKEVILWIFAFMIHVTWISCRLRQGLVLRQLSLDLGTSVGQVGFYVFYELFCRKI